MSRRTRRLSYVLAALAILETGFGLSARSTLWHWFGLAGLALVVAIEMLGAGIATVGVVRAWRRHREVDAFIRSVIPVPIAASFVLYELHGWGALARAVTRLGRKRPPGEFSYSGLMLPAMIMITTLVAAEIPGVTILGLVLIKNHWIDAALLIAGAYGLWWVLAFWAGLTTRPHTVSADSTHLNFGTMTTVRIPMEAVSEIAQERKNWEGRALGVVKNADGSVALVVNSETTLRLHTYEEVAVESLGSQTLTRTVYFNADAPREMLAALQRSVRGDRPQASAELVPQSPAHLQAS